MYAAAGGASCRQARKRQAQNVKDKAAQAKALKDKLADAKEASTPTKSKQFHQLPASYLRTQQAHGRKLSTGYTGHSKHLLPISEQSAHHHSPSQQFLHDFHHPEALMRRHSRLPGVEHKTLTKSATATFPLASQASHHHDDQPGTPTVCFYQHPFSKPSQSNLLSAHHHQQQQHQPIHIQIPGPMNDGIIITPATPLPSPSPSSQNQKQQDNQQLATQPIAQQAEQLPATIDDLPEFPLERACSVYRNRKLDETAVDMDEQQASAQQQFYPGGMPNGHHTHWTDDLCDSEHRNLGVCTCDHVEVIRCCSLPFCSFVDVIVTEFHFPF